MKDKIKSSLLTLLRFAPFGVCVVLMALYLFSGEEFTAESLLSLAPEKPLFAALFLILLYGLKSLTVVFPIVVLNVLGGFLFEPRLALLVNTVGVIVELTVPYWVGRISGSGFSEKLRSKYPRLAEAAGHSGSDFFRAFFLRVIACLPGDAVSMYFGAVRMPFFTCLMGSLLGTFPSMAAATLLGVTITDPTSPMFWISAGLTVGMSVLSVTVYTLWRKHKAKKSDV